MQVREYVLLPMTDLVSPRKQGVHPVTLLYGDRICGQLVESSRSEILLSDSPCSRPSISTQNNRQKSEFALRCFPKMNYIDTGSSGDVQIRH